MAKPPRAIWVHKPWHNYHYLPRPNYSYVEYNPEEMEATPETFKYKLDEPPPKLWVAWLFRIPRVQRAQGDNLRRLFGDDLKRAMNKMKVFKNTPYWNDLLWRAKSFIEVRPITFPHGEPTEQDINFTTILSSGECVVNKNVNIDENQLVAKPEDDLKNFPLGYISSKLTTKWNQGREVQEDEVWGDPKQSRF